ncbi:hypothetical protein SCA03_48470 [Streptomyces cacaoi]|uniref:Uncharacterized protein n=1 Tax=Streptomyces cacaoi TaxID=1898 RepID=A0A4Y3R3I6_STRCI|nr:hypothetical protein SCA03_48470 [Streptomyces cacaoi]
MPRGNGAGGPGPAEAAGAPSEKPPGTVRAGRAVRDVRYSGPHARADDHELVVARLCGGPPGRAYALRPSLIARTDKAARGAAFGVSAAVPPSRTARRRTAQRRGTRKEDRA